MKTKIVDLGCNAIGIELIVCEGKWAQLYTVPHEASSMLSTYLCLRLVSFPTSQPKVILKPLMKTEDVTSIFYAILLPRVLSFEMRLIVEYPRNARFINYVARFKILLSLYILIPCLPLPSISASRE